MLLAVEAAETHKYEAQLDNEVARACQLEEKLRQKERKALQPITSQGGQNEPNKC